MTTKAKPTETEIRYAIEYALRSETVTAEVSDGCGGSTHEVVYMAASDLEPLVMRMLQELQVI